MQTPSNVAVALSVLLALCLLSFLPPEASAIPREREAFYKWSPRYCTWLISIMGNKLQVFQYRKHFCVSNILSGRHFKITT